MEKYYLLRIYNENKGDTDRFVIRVVDGKLETIAGNLHFTMTGFNTNEQKFSARNGDFEFSVSPSGVCVCDKFPETTSVTLSDINSGDIPSCQVGLVRQMPDGSYGFNRWQTE